VVLLWWNKNRKITGNGTSYFSTFQRRCDRLWPARCCWQKLISSLWCWARVGRLVGFSQVLAYGRELIGKKNRFISWVLCVLPFWFGICAPKLVERCCKWCELDWFREIGELSVNTEFCWETRLVLNPLWIVYRWNIGNGTWTWNILKF